MWRGERRSVDRYHYARFALIVIVAGCGNSPEEPPSLPGLATPPCAFNASWFVVQSMALPQSSNEATVLTSDLDSNGRRENSIAFLFGFLSEVTRIHGDAALRDGRMALLIKIESCGGTNEYVRASLALANDLDSDPSDNFNGQEAFELQRAADVAAVGTMSGDGEVVAELGVSPIGLSPFLSTTSRPLGMVLARAFGVEAELSGGGLRGTFHMGLEINTTRDDLVVPLADLLRL